MGSFFMVVSFSFFDLFDGFAFGFEFVGVDYQHRGCEELDCSYGEFERFQD